MAHQDGMGQYLKSEASNFKPVDCWGEGEFRFAGHLRCFGDFKKLESTYFFKTINL